MADQPAEELPRVYPSDLLVINDLETLKVAADPLRLSIINLLRAEPRTAKGLAKALDLPQTKLYYHISLLEQHGLVRVTETRLVSGIMEKRYQATASRLTVGRALFEPSPGEPASEESREAYLQVFLSAVLDYTRDDMLRSLRAGLADLSDDAPPERALHVGRRWFWLTPEQAGAFTERINALMDEFDAQRLDATAEGVQLYEFLLGFFPTHERPSIPPDATSPDVMDE
jgi:DNA-binding transcriptional ArsR family regulator